MPTPKIAANVSAKAGAKTNVKAGDGHGPVYKRIVLKLSGESLQGPLSSGIHAETVAGIAQELKEVNALGVQVAIMVGGGNIFRGGRQKSFAIDRATGDYMGMLATVINALALQDALEKLGMPHALQSAIEMHQVAEPFIRRRAMRHLEKAPHGDFRAPAPVILIFRRTPRRLCAPWKSKRK